MSEKMEDLKTKHLQESFEKLSPGAQNMVALWDESEATTKTKLEAMRYIRDRSMLEGLADFLSEISKALAEGFGEGLDKNA